MSLSPWATAILPSCSARFGRAPPPHPDGAPAKDNPTKVFQTKGGNTVTLDDTKDKTKIEIKTAKDTAILLDDENEKITVHDAKNKNQIIIDAKNGTVTVQADKKIIFKAGNKDMLVLDGSGKKITADSGSIDLKAQQAVNIKGQNLTVDGTSVAVKGKSAVNVQSNGTTVVKGTMVKIN